MESDADGLTFDCLWNCFEDDELAKGPQPRCGRGFMDAVLEALAACLDYRPPRSSSARVSEGVYARIMGFMGELLGGGQPTPSERAGGGEAMDPAMRRHLHALGLWFALVQGGGDILLPRLVRVASSLRGIKVLSECLIGETRPGARRPSIIHIQTPAIVAEQPWGALCLGMPMMRPGFYSGRLRVSVIGMPEPGAFQMVDSPEYFRCRRGGGDSDGPVMYDDATTTTPQERPASAAYMVVRLQVYGLQYVRPLPMD